MLYNPVIINQDSDTITLKPTGNADADTLNLKNAFKTHRNIKLGSGVFTINESVVVDVIPDDYGLRGRIVDFNKCTVNVVAKNGVFPDNAFVFLSSDFPKNLRNTEIRNGIFDGKVNQSFIKMQGSTVYNCTIENIHSTFQAIANALVEFNSTMKGANSGINIVRNLYPYTHIKNTLLFSANTGADGQFDDFIIECISNIYMDGLDGATVKLNDNTQLVYSHFKVLYFGGKGHCIRGGNNTYVQDCNIQNIYMEPKCPSTVAMFTNFFRCKADIVHMKYDPAITTFARATYGILVNSTISHVYQTNNVGQQINKLYCEEIGNSYGNTYNKVGYGAESIFIKKVTQ
ncbi:MAG: hypothetical protein LC100_06230 [Chitinophagales bacterium]|nr:hypothetical protein [Chitinophagales bacterium]